MDGLNNYLDSSNHYTENGAKTFSGTFSKVLDLFAMGGAMRGRSMLDRTQKYADAFAENPLVATKVLFYLRDCRGGQGAKDIFQDGMIWLANNHFDVFAKNIAHIPEYGYWKDVFVIMQSVSQQAKELCADVVKAQWHQDINAYNKGDDVSLLAKWMPSENASSKESTRLARYLANHMNQSYKWYRTWLSRLREKINILETYMSGKKWHEINYENVPSVAIMKQRKAFHRHDSSRYTDYLEKVKSGEQKINASVLSPCDIVNQLITSYGWRISLEAIDETLEAQWKALPDYVGDKKENSLVVCDCSGSMTSNTGSIKPIGVAIGLSIYLAERNKGAFHNTFMTFSSDPHVQTIKGTTLHSKIRHIVNTPGHGLSTNLAKTFEVLLEYAMNLQVSEDEMPDRVYIVSDMEFDNPSVGGHKTNFETIEKLYEDAGFKMPEVVFWNVNSHQDNLPIYFDESGVALVSGYSPSILKILLGHDNLTPATILLDTISQSRYDQIAV